MLIERALSAGQGARRQEIVIHIAVEVNIQNFREILERQKKYFNSDATKSYERRTDQLDRLERLL